MAGTFDEMLITIKLEKDDYDLLKQPKSKELKEDKSKELRTILIHQGIQTAKQIVTQAITTTFNRYLTMKEDYLTEQLYSNTMAILGKVTGFVSVVGVGASFAGPIGASIATLGYGISETISLNNRYNEYYKTLNASNMNVDFARTRAGLMDNGRGTEN